MLSNATEAVAQHKIMFYYNCKTWPSSSAESDSQLPHCWKQESLFLKMFYQNYFEILNQL